MSEFRCPECGKEVESQRGLSQHRAKIHGIMSPTSSTQRGGTTARPVETGRLDDVKLRELHDRLIGHFSAIATLLGGLGLYHSSLTLVTRAVDREVTVIGPDGQPLTEKGRPVSVHRRGIARILVDHGRRDPRIMRGILAFDRVMSAGDELQTGLEIAAAVAADLVPDPRAGVKLPGTRIVLAPAVVIPDVVQEVENIRAMEAQMEAAAAGGAGSGGGGEQEPREPRPPAPEKDGGVEVIQGGVTAT